MPLELNRKGLGWFFLIPPEFPEAIRCQRHITLRAEQRAMPEISLDRTAVVAIVGELVSCAMAQHMAVDLEPELGRPSSPRDHSLISSHAERKPICSN